jgi:hypothetical protein
MSTNTPQKPLQGSNSSSGRIPRLGSKSFIFAAAAMSLACLTFPGLAQTDGAHELAKSPGIDDFLAKHPDTIVRLKCNTLTERDAICGFLGLVANSSSNDGYDRLVYYFGPASNSGNSTRPYVDRFVNGLKEFRDHNHFVRSSRSGGYFLPDLDTLLRDSRTDNGTLHPFLDYPASVDYDEVLSLSYGLKLLDINSTEIKIPNESYNKVNYSAAQSLDEYDNVPYGSEQGICGEGKQFAILVNEPHAQQDQESDLFSFLNYIHVEYPTIFSHLYVLQEGQYAGKPINSSHVDTVIGRDQDATGSMILASAKEWRTNIYSPLNVLGLDTQTGKIQEDFVRFLKEKSIPIDSNVAKQTLERQLRFYARMTPATGLNPADALMAIDTPPDLNQRLEKLQPGDVELVTALINNPNIDFRGALAYKLYVDGNDAGRAESSAIKVFGLEDLGLYLSSCALNPVCALPLVGKGDSGLDPKEKDKFKAVDRLWIGIQPYRDAVMASYVLDLLGDAKESITPIVLASVETHLPIVRKLLCAAGVTSAMLEPKENQPGALPTTPFSPFLYNPQSAFKNWSQFGTNQLPSTGTVEQFYGNATAFGYPQ